MTEESLAGHATAMSRLADSWSHKATGAVGEAVDRAHAHAIVALTETLRATPDGRRTLRKASRSRSYLAALKDLDDLTRTLAGASVVSLDGMLRDARESAYRTSFASWVSIFPDAYSLGKAAEPYLARVVEVRGLVLHGTELRREVGASVDRAKRSLLATLEMSSRKASGRSSGRIDGWKVTTTADLCRTAIMAIGDSFVAIDSIAGVDAVKPEFRPKNRYTPG